MEKLVQQLLEEVRLELVRRFGGHQCEERRLDVGILDYRIDAHLEREACEVCYPLLAEVGLHDGLGQRESCQRLRRDGRQTAELLSSEKEEHRRVSK